MEASGRGLRGLRVSLLAGAAYDLALGAFVLVWGERIMDGLGHPLGVSRPFFLMASLPLFLLPAVYVGAAAARDTLPFRLPVLWARGGGGVGLFLLTVLGKPPVPWLFLGFAVLDVGWALLHLALWRRNGTPVQRG
jgi:hypothetical protein